MNDFVTGTTANSISRVPRPRILLVLTREIPSEPKSGRERTLGFIQRALATRFDVQTFDAKSIVHRPSLRRILEIPARLLWGVVTRNPCPLQVAIFHDSRGFALLLSQLAESRPEAVYFDSVRTVDWLVSTRRRYPNTRLICDFDDVMSLRFETLLVRRLPISLGYLGSHAPAWLKRCLQHGLIARSILRYEAWSLRASERLAVSAANVVTVVSTADAEKLSADIGTPLSDRVRVVAPGVHFPSPLIRTRECLEFIFVGSDTLLQNRLSIEYLLKLWSEIVPRVPLRIVGRMSGNYPSRKGVTFSGFVADINEVYSDVCVSLCPAFVEGGIKTKVLEALGQGVIPVGNALTFAGMDCDAGSLAMSLENLSSFVRNPKQKMDELRDSATKLRECALRRYSFAAVAEGWAQIMSPAITRPRADPSS